MKGLVPFELQQVLGDIQAEGAVSQQKADAVGIGLLLGAVWSPCVGPTLGAASVMAAPARYAAAATADRPSLRPMIETDRW